VAKEGNRRGATSSGEISPHSLVTNISLVDFPSRDAICSGRAMANFAAAYAVSSGMRYGKMLLELLNLRLSHFSCSVSNRAAASAVVRDRVPRSGRGGSAISGRGGNRAEGRRGGGRGGELSHPGDGAGGIRRGRLAIGGNGGVADACPDDAAGDGGCGVCVSAAGETFSMAARKSVDGGARHGGRRGRW